MCEEIRPGLFRLRIPLPKSPLKYLNSYIVRSVERHLIIDTGFNHPVCLAAMQSGLKELAIDLECCDFFITHLHADHFALMEKLITDSSRVFFSRPEKEIIESWEGFEPMIAHAGRNGFPADQLRAALEQHPGREFGTDWVPEMQLLDDGDRIDYGDYHFRCVTTPGHTLGHICLYEASQKILVAGDHILDDITPNIQCWSDAQNPLGHYLDSLDKVARLDVDLVLPGHRRLISDHRGRIQALKDHHLRRLEEILSILDDGPLHAYAVAAKMSWDIACDSWEAFPVPQKWFATGEALSHLRYLAEAGRVRQLDASGNSRYLKIPTTATRLENIGQPTA